MHGITSGVVTLWPRDSANKYIYIYKAINIEDKLKLKEQSKEQRKEQGTEQRKYSRREKGKAGQVWATC